MDSLQQFLATQQNNPQLAQLQQQLSGLFNSYDQLNKLKTAAQPQPAISAPTQNIPTVRGLEGAEAYLKNMLTNSSAAPFDQDEPVFYLLTKDANGVPGPIKLGRFTLEDAPKPESNVLTKKDLDDFRNEIRAMFAQNGKSKKVEKVEKEAGAE